MKALCRQSGEGASWRQASSGGLWQCQRLAQGQGREDSGRIPGAGLHRTSDGRMREQVTGERSAQAMGTLEGKTAECRGDG